MSRVIVTPELWNKVLDENKELLDGFMDYCRSRGLSPRTIESYYNDIQICWVWNLQHNKNIFFVDFTKRCIIKYQNWLIYTLENSPNRVGRMKSALSSLSKYIEMVLDDVYIGFRNIVNSVPAPVKQLVREKTVLTDEQVDMLLKYLVDNKRYQQACAFALAVASGARKSELLRFKVSYFADNNVIYGSLYKTPEKIKTKGRGAGKFIYKYVLRSKFKPYFDLWMKQREELGINGEELFWTKRKGVWVPADISLFNSWAKTFTEILGVNFYWHSLRSYHTTMLAKARIPADVIKDMIGWESTAMVDLYNALEVDEELGRYFDEGGIKQVEQKGLGDL